MAKLKYEISEQDLKKMIIEHFKDVMNVTIDPVDIKIEVKSKQNYRAEWEVSDFRASISKDNT